MAKTNVGLVEYAKAQIGLPYWYGTFGQTSSEALYKNKKAQYPKYYTATDFSKQYGKRVHDCSGLIKGYLMSVSATAAPTYNASFDKSADGFFNSCTETGSISTLPEIPGVVLWKKDHIGVYIGNGYVVEAKGHAYGVIQSKVKDTPWTHWGKLKFIDYTSTKINVNNTSTNINVTINARQLSYGMKGEDVKALQALLNLRNNANLEVDGSFGNKTMNAVDDFCKKHNLTPIDGIAGTRTWNTLVNG